VEVLEEDDYSGSHPGQAHSAPYASMRVTIMLPSLGFSSQQNFVDFDDICFSIDEALQEKKHLRLYLATPTQLRCDKCAMTNFVASSIGWKDTVSLDQILSASTSTPRRISLPDCTFLAVNLASSLLQLHDTPWLRTCLSKENIQFLKGSLPGVPNASVSSQVALSTIIRINIRQPLVSETFPTNHGASSHQRPVSPKETLLELAILLLELWDDMTLEARFQTSSLGGDYTHRRNLAMQWLDELGTIYFRTTEKRYLNASRVACACHPRSRGATVASAKPSVRTSWSR
jgi:hypothetical protein